MMPRRKVVLSVVFVCTLLFWTAASANTPPYVPFQPAPADASTNVDPQTTALSWTGGDPDTDDSVTYGVYFGTSQTPPFYVSTSASSINIGPLAPLQTYYWQVIAKDSLDAEAVGPVWTFTTGAAVLSNVSYTTDTVLSKDLSPYIVQGVLTVNPGVTLTVEPGTILKFESGSSLHVENGIVVAEGAADDRIIFTSYRSDHHGGDTNNDGSDSMPAAGDWNGISFTRAGETASVNLKNCIIEYAAGINITSTVDQLSLNIQDNIIRHHSSDGIYFEASEIEALSMQLTGNQISGNTGRGLNLRLDGGTAAMGATISNNTISNNGTEAVYFYNDSADSLLDITANTVSDHFYHGIWLDNYTNGSISLVSNTVTNCGSALALSSYTGESFFNIDANELSNGRDGIHIYARGNTRIGAAVVNNHIHHNSATGIECLTLTDASVIEADISNNRIYANGDKGIECSPWIYADEPRGHIYTRVASNHIYENGGWGMYFWILDPVHVYYNRVHDNVTGGIFLDVDNVTKINFNDIYDNADCNIYKNRLTAIDIQRNYWGPYVTSEMERLKDIYPWVSASFELCSMWHSGFEYWDWLHESITAHDSDADKLPDAWEQSNGLYTDSPDSDGDQIDDGDEYLYWSRTTGWDKDPDNDGVINLLDADADNDGIADGIEISTGTRADIPPGAPVAIYENGENGAFAGWMIYDGNPASAAINNVYDNGRQSRVIELAGEGTVTGFQLRNPNGSAWDDQNRPVLTFDLKTSGYFIIYIDLQTSYGQRYLRYEPVDWSGYGGGQYVHYGIGSGLRDGAWHTVCRNLQADLDAAQPGIVVQKVNGFLMRGSAGLDDIKLTVESFDSDNDNLSDLEEIQIHGTDPNRTDTDMDGLSDFEEIDAYGTDPLKMDTDMDGLQDFEEVDFWNGWMASYPQLENSNWWQDFDGDGLVNLLDADADNDGVPDGHEILVGSHPLDGLNGPAMVYENAEDGSTTGWEIYDGHPAYADITSSFDHARQSRVVELDGDGLSNGFRLRTEAGQPWQNSQQKVIAWAMKSTQHFIVYIDVQTTAGQRYLMYTPSVYDELGGGQYVHHGLGIEMIDGHWHTVVRDLAADLKAAQPDEDILEINGFLFRGSACFDDISLMSPASDTDRDDLPDVDELSIFESDPNSADTDVDNIDDGMEVHTYGTDPLLADTDSDGLADWDEVALWEGQWNADPDGDGLVNLVDIDSDNDGAVDGVEFGLNTDPADGSDFPVTVYEDAEDNLTEGWEIYDGITAAASIINTFDTELGSHVIRLEGNGTAHGFLLANADGSPWHNTEQFVLEWRMNSAGYFFIYIDIQTTAGHRYLKYTPSDYDDLGEGEYVHMGLGGSAGDGTWKLFSRDLQADLNAAQPGVDILEVNAFLVRGNMLLDDIRLRY